MRLNEIIDTSVSLHHSDKQFRNRSGRLVRDRRRKENPNSGYFSSVTNTQDPHMVSKTNHFATAMDGWDFYIDYIIKNELNKTNPYTPRIYSYKKVVDKNGKFRYKVKMEKLHKIDSFDDDVIAGLTRQLFPNALKNRKIIDLDADMLVSLVSRNEPSSDPKLNEIIDIINKIINTTRYYDDIKLDNVMIRLSPHPQLVITDPLA